jgi:hypothetical protein
MRGRLWALTAMLVGCFASLGASAQTLYAASFRSSGIGTGANVAGSLYTINLASGAATFLAPLRVNGTVPIGVTGIAVHPETGLFYAVTPAQSPNFPQSLVTIDSATGRATVVGDMRYPASDIAFNRAGILFGWLPATSQVGIINLTSGNVTPIGTPRQPGTPSGLAIDKNGAAYITTGGAGGTLDTVDLATGNVVRGPPMTGAPFPTGVNSMTFSASGLLLAVNSNGGAPAETRLVTINTATGAVSPIGNLPDDTDALSFANESQKESLSKMNVQTLALMVLGVIALILGLIGWFVGRKPTAR